MKIFFATIEVLHLLLAVLDGGGPDVGENLRDGVGEGLKPNHTQDSQVLSAKIGIFTIFKGTN